MPRLLFTSRHCILDPASGAAGATLDLLTLLASRGWDCRALCGAARDAGGPATAEALAAEGIAFETRRPPGGAFAVLHARPGGVPTAVCALDRDSAGNDGRELLALFDRFVAGWRPDLVLTYGGDSVARELLERAAAARLPVVFALHNFAYTDPGLFRKVRGVLVPSEFSKRHYARKLGLKCVALPSPIDPARCVAADGSNRRFVTFVNPAPNKGAFVFARIADELCRRRPDVPLLVVEGRGRASRLDQTGIDLRSHPNLFVMKNTPDPREIYAASRVLLMPSLWDESFGRVAAEAMLNGIPVVASDRWVARPVRRELAGVLQHQDAAPSAAIRS